MPSPLYIPGDVPTRTRFLMLAVFDGDKRVLPKLYELWGLEFYRLDEILAWLVKNRITGKEFWAFLQEGPGRGSLLETISYILMQINHDLIAKPIIAGRDTK